MDAEVASLRADGVGLQAELDEAAATDQVQRAGIAESIAISRHELADAVRRQRELTITAPIAGTLVAPKLAELAGSASCPAGRRSVPSRRSTRWSSGP